MNKLVWLLVPALLVMASCRSAKKATDNGTDKTRAAKSGAPEEESGTWHSEGQDTGLRR